MRYLFLAVVWVLGACSGSDDGEPVPVTQPTPTPTAQHYSFFERVSSSSFSDVLALPYNASDQTLSYGPDSLQKLEYWMPVDINGRESLPAILLIHGGCWSNAFRVQQTYPIATALALNGFPVWSAEYRATGDVGGGWPGTFEDIQQAIFTLTENSDNFYSQRELVIIGHSAGGHLGLLAGSQASNTADIVGIAPIVDIIDYAEGAGSCNGLARSFMGGTPQDYPARYVEANPDPDNLSGSVFLFFGSNDTVIPENQAVNSGLPYQTISGAGHFDFIHPGTDTFDEVLFYLLETYR